MEPLNRQISREQVENESKLFERLEAVESAGSSNMICIIISRNAHINRLQNEAIQYRNWKIGPKHFSIGDKGLSSEACRGVRACWSGAMRVRRRAELLGVQCDAICYDSHVLLGNEPIRAGVRNPVPKHLPHRPLARPSLRPPSKISRRIPAQHLRAILALITQTSRSASASCIWASRGSVTRQSVTCVVRSTSAATSAAEAMSKKLRETALFVTDSISRCMFLSSPRPVFAEEPH